MNDTVTPLFHANARIDGSRIARDPPPPGAGVTEGPPRPPPRAA